MVKVREDYPQNKEGKIDFDQWSDKFLSSYSNQQKILLQEVYAKFIDKFSSNTLEIIEILHNLNSDQDTLVAAMVFQAGYDINDPKIQFLSLGAKNLLINTVELNQVFNNHINTTKQSISANYKQLRKLMLSMVNDIRVIIIKLVVHLIDLRTATSSSDHQKRHLAYLAQEIYAPLANYLGIGQVKWEIEDFSFRYLEPDIYQNIAKLLDEKRIARQNYILDVVCYIKDKMNENHIELVDVSGRAKHIYSIWKKMQRKMVGYHEIYDVRAIRIILNTIPDCYSALGVIHGMWQHIPKEFDDYIANQKQNGYQSLHTAVVGPNAKILEVQLRTKEMHEFAEKGVASHWLYKEGGTSSAEYQEKVNNMRSALGWYDDASNGYENASTGAITTKLDYDDERVYVFTPKGDIYDLPYGSTPLDFAYAIHTDVGHRCRGAKVNGSMVSLNFKLKSGCQVEIITVKEPSPSRDWLNLDYKYLITNKARSRVYQWFKRQDRDKNISAGREILNRELKRLSIRNLNIKDIVNTVANCSSESDMLAGLGAGDIRIAQILGAISRTQLPDIVPGLKMSNSKIAQNNRKGTRDDIIIDGMGNISCKLAKCCNPLPGEDIIGYITLGEGVSIHSKNCQNILNVKDDKKNRLIDAKWRTQINNQYVVVINVKAYNRRGLLRDISAVLANEHVDVVEVNSLTDYNEQVASFKILIEISGVDILSKVFNKLLQVAGVIEVLRLYTL